MAGENASAYCGLYINLDRSAARRERMQAQLGTLGIASRYERFSAIDGAAVQRPGSALRPGELGAFLSHKGALEAGRAKGAAAVHILEDDALLSRHVAPVIEEAIAGGLFERYDVIFTDALIAPHLGMLKGLKSIFDKVERPERPLRLAELQAIDLAHQNFSCMTSYVVGARAIDRVLALYRAEVENGPSKPVDLFMREMVQTRRLRAVLLFPLVTSFRLDEIAASTIAGQPEVPPSVMVLAVLRYLFFVERELALAKACLDKATQKNRRAGDAHHEMMMQALDFILSDAFEEF